MLGHTLATSVAVATIVTALPYSFVLDTGSIDSAIIDAPLALLPNTTTDAFVSSTATQISSSASLMCTPVPTSYSNATSTIGNSTTSATCLPTTTVTITLPNPTPRPNPDAERGKDKDKDEDEDEDPSIDLDDEQPEQHNQGDLFNTDVPIAVSKWPHWFTAATFTLVFYDIITLGLFLWLWVFGYLWWFRRGSESRLGGRGMRGAVSEGMEMVPVVDRFGRYERTSDWVTHGRYGRVRSRSWERARTAREAELESEMRRLDMI